MTTVIATKNTFKWLGSGEKQALFAFKNGALLAAARVRFTPHGEPAVKASIYGFAWAFGRGGLLETAYADPHHQMLLGDVEGAHAAIEERLGALLEEASEIPWTAQYSQAKRDALQEQIWQTYATSWNA